MQDVDSSALKKPILSGVSSSNNGGATGNSGGGGNNSEIYSADNMLEDDRDLMEERADRKKTNWRLMGLGTYARAGQLSELYFSSIRLGNRS